MMPAAAYAAEPAEKTTSVEYIEDVSSEPRPGLKKLSQSKVYIRGTMYRSDSFNIGENGNTVLTTVWIGNTQTRQDTRISYNEKTVEQSQMSDAGTQHIQQSPEVLRHLAEHDAEFIGEEMLNEKKTLAYKVKKFQLGDGRELKENETVKVWIDPINQLPVQILIETWLGVPGKVAPFINREILSNFKWDEPIDPNQFKPEVPAGFKKIEHNPPPAK